MLGGKPLRRSWRRGATPDTLEETLRAMTRNVADLPLVAAHWCDAIGTTLRDFGRSEAAEWLDRAVRGYREAGEKFGQGAPSIKVALTLWKAARTEEMKEECSRILIWSAPALERAATGRVMERNSWTALEAGVEASFLMGHYEPARERAAIASAASLREFGPSGADRRSDCDGVSFLSEGVLADDAPRFRTGLDVLSDQIEEWPTPRCSVREDLFRVGLALPTADAAAYIRSRLPDHGSENGDVFAGGAHAESAQ